MKRGVHLYLDGGGNTLKLGDSRFLVADGAQLCLYNMNLIDGSADDGSAIVVGDAASRAGNTPAIGMDNNQRHG